MYESHQTEDVKLEISPEELAKRQVCERLADVLLRHCLSRERITEMEPVYDAVRGYAAQIISFVGEIKRNEEEHKPFTFQLAQLENGDFRTDSALQRVLRKLSRTEESNLFDVVEVGDAEIGISSWVISVGGVGMSIHRSKDLHDGEAPITYTVDNFEQLSEINL